jgi:hypothetical protein
MKKILVVTLIIVVMILSIIFSPAPKAMAATETPPPLPSSFYGQVSGAPVGALVSAVVDGHTTTTSVRYYPGYGTVYSIDVTGGNNKDWINFYVNGTKVATAVFMHGTDVNLDLKLPIKKPIKILPVMR